VFVLIRLVRIIVCAVLFINVNACILLVLPNCAKGAIHHKTSSKLITLAELLLIGAVIAVQLSCSNILCIAVILAIATASVNTGLEFLIPTCSLFASLLKAFSMLITLNEHASTAVLKVELLPSFFAGVVVTSFVTILEVPSVIEINVHGTYHGEGHSEEDNCKYVLDHHFCFECVG